MTTLEHRPPVALDVRTWRGRALVPVLVYVGLLVAIVSSLGSPLVPTLAADYHVSLGAAQWSLTITLLVGAVTAPVVGRLGDGPRRLHVLLTCLGILVCGSVLAALPSGVFAILLAGRGMQGVGLALLPLVMGVARDHLQPEQTRATLATLSVTAVVGVGLGYPVTGLIAEHLNFRAGFWMAAGLGMAALVLSAVVVPTSMHRERQRFDLPGAALLGLGLTALLVSISEGGDWGWMSSRLLGLGALSVLTLAAWTWHELDTGVPMIDLRLMRNRTVLTANVSAILAGVGMYMLMSMIIRYVQTPRSTGYGLAESVVVSGLVLLPLSAASFLATKLMSYLGRWVGPARMLPLGIVAFAASLVMFATSRTQLWQIFVAMGIGGIGIGCSFAVMPRMIVGSTPADETSSALAMNQVLRTVGYAVGSALAATILTAHTVAPSRFPTNHGYTVGAVVGVVLCLFTAVVSWCLHARQGTATTVMDVDGALQVEETADAAIASVIAFEPTEQPVENAAVLVGRR